VDGIPYRGQAKKLADAAEHWARGGVEDKTADDLTAFGLSGEIADAAAAASVSADFEIFEENADILMMFLRLQTQWQISAGGVVGLNYQSAEFLFRITGVENPGDLLEGLQVMELAALRVLNAKRD
jgi:hypothetical protein